MKYVTHNNHYYRETDSRIEDTSELRRVIREQARMHQGKVFTPITASAILGISFVVIFLILAIMIALFDTSHFKFISDAPNFFLVFIITFLVLGLVNVLYPVLSSAFLKSKCTSETTGKCVGFDDYIYKTKYSTHICSCPVYSFTENYSEYLVYDSKYTRKASDLPQINETVIINFDPSNPERCIIDDKTDWFPLGILMGALFLVISFMLFSFVQSNSVHPTRTAGDKILLSDEYILSAFNKNHEDTDFYIFKADVKEIDGSVIYLENCPGIPPFILSTEGLMDCETVYIINFTNPNLTDMYLDASKYEYDGELATDTFMNEDGKFELTEEYLNHYTECISWDIYSLTIDRIGDNRVYVIDGNGRDFYVTFDPMYDPSMFNLEEGDEVYMVNGIHGAVFFDKEYNYYDGFCR